MEPVEAKVIERDGLRLVVDPIAQAAINSAIDAGISSPASFGALPDAEDLPLIVVGLQCRVELLEGRMAQLEAAERLRRSYG